MTKDSTNWRKRKSKLTAKEDELNSGLDVRVAILPGNDRDVSFCTFRPGGSGIGSEVRGRAASQQEIHPRGGLAGHPLGGNRDVICLS